MAYFGFLDPEGRITRRLCLYTCDRKIVGVYPNLAAVQELILAFGFDFENVSRSSRGGFVTCQDEIVIVGG